MTDRRKPTRREFVRTAGATAALGMSGTFLAAHSRPAAARVLGANERVNLGVIGCGWRGGQHMKELVRRQKEKGDCQLVAVSDLYVRRLREAEELTGAKGYRDYNELLARDDIDGIITPTPWHWHAKISLDAMNAGKDVYVETPMAINIDDAKEVYETQVRQKRILEVGNQMACWDEYHRAREVVQSGVLGKIVLMTASWARNSREGQWNYVAPHACAITEDATAQTTNWPIWQGWSFGLAPQRDFDRERFFRFRKYRGYGGGSASDLLCHTLGAMLVATGHEFPLKVSSAGGQYVEFDRDIYDTYITTIEYPSQYTTVLDGTMVSEYTWPEVIRGHEGVLVIDREGVTVAPERPFEKDFEDRCEKAGLKGEWTDVELPRWGRMRKARGL
ncbi:hypothetical protein AMJ85_07765, partial [candidate division BRC1 bacterium SM23_51]